MKDKEQTRLQTAGEEETLARNAFPGGASRKLQKLNPRSQRLIKRTLRAIDRRPCGLEKFQRTIDQRHRIALSLAWERLLKIALEGSDRDAISAAQVLATRFDPDFKKQPSPSEGRNVVDDLLALLRKNAPIESIEATNKKQTLKIHLGPSPG